MVHPSELLRTNSNETRTFSAPRAEYQLDCGITNLPILNRCCDLEKLAKPKVFLVFLSIVGFLQGVTLTYFRETARTWGKHYSISQDNIDWLIYTDEFFIGIIALVVAYYGNKIHRISWIGGLTMFQAIASGLLLIPEIYRRNYKIQETTDSNLCVPNSSSSKDSDYEVNYIALAVLIIFQVFYAMASISFISHAITYIDDNTSEKTSPAHIGIALAFRELGRQAGLYFSWIPNYFNLNAIFVSPVWLSIASAAFLSGIFIAMFPKNMPSTMVRALSASLVDLAAGYTAPPPKEIVDGFFKTLFRLLRNKILLVNIFCAVFLQSGLVNFNIFEKYFNQARFQISEINDTSYIQFTTNILKQPLVAISLIAAGFVVAKTQPQLKSLVKWNIIVIILVIVFFGSTAFLECEPHTKYDEMMARNVFNEGCNCGYEFQPVCTDNRKTYYSPCFAGCRNKSNSGNEYGYCLGRNDTRAEEGPCSNAKCDQYYALSQINRVFTTALIASTLVTNLIINMRCILARDKAMALGLEVTFTVLITYLPVRAIYGAVAEHYCAFPKNNKGVCRLYSKKFSTFLSLCTMGFMVLSLILALLVFIFLKLASVEQQDDDEDEDDPPIELEERHIPRDEPDSGHLRVAPSMNSISASLLDMEDVGDDHDSVDSSSFLDDTRINRRVIESDL